MRRALFVIAIITLSLCMIMSIPSSKAYAEDEQTYYNPTQISIYNNNVYVLDSGIDTNGHFLKNVTKNITIGSYGFESNKLYSPTLFAVNNDYIFIYNNNKEIKQFSTDGEFLKIHYRYYDGNNEYEPTNVLFTFNDTDSNVYFVDSNNNVIVYQNDRMELAFTISDSVNIDESSQIVCDLLNNVYIINNDSITKYDMDTNQYTNYPNTIQYNNVDIDYQGTLYFQNNTTITKFNLTNNNQDSTTCIDYTDFCIDKVNGDIYYISSNNVSTQKLIVDTKNFVDNLNEFNKPTHYLDAVLLDAPVQIYKTKNDAKAYEYPYFINQLATLNKGDKVLVIGENQDFKHCIITSSKLGNIVCYIKSSNLESCNYQQVNKQMRIITQNPIVYKYPTSLGYGTLSPITVQIELSYNQNVIVTREINDFEDGSGRAFYEIKLDDKYCYVNVSNVGSSLPSAQTSGVKMNATIQAASSIEEIVVYNEEDKEIDKIKVNTRVHVDHFDKELNKTKITYVVDDEVRTGYVETKYISIDGLKIEIIVAIVMSIIAIVIAIILIPKRLQ